ncbi:MAG: HpaII family restriction endonuclease [Bacteroidaceae bacterium]|nr:HpaII family restriction endonuclease [Bacteroidaceae bacterium]
MKLSEFENDDYRKEASDEIKVFLTQYLRKNGLTPEQLSVILRCSVHVVYAILNATCNFSLRATEYIENRLNLDLSNAKSHIGSSPTLFNCSSTSGFIYRVVGCDVDGMYRLNYKEGFRDIIDAIKKDYSLEYAGCRNEIFEQNLRMIDWRMDEILSHALLMQIGYNEGLDSSNIEDMCAALAKENPLGARNPNYFYESKIKCLLFASFAGMTASTEWNGRKKLTGGYIDVDKDGELLYYRAISDDIFENYLYKHTYLDRPDRGACKTLAMAEAKVRIDEKRELTEAERKKIIYKNGKDGTKNSKKGDFGYVYQDGEDFYIVVNFQIRFR